MDKSVTENIIPHNHQVTKTDRVLKNGYNPCLVWFTGLSGSGKSTLASGVEKELHKRGYNTYILDGDNIRRGLNHDLDFSDASRKENIRRISEVANLFLDAGVIILSAFVSPFREDRRQAKSLVGADNFIEIFADCPLEECEKRDVKGLYAKARRGEIKNFTGIDSPFEKPESADAHIETHKSSIEAGVSEVLEIINRKIENNE